MVDKGLPEPSLSSQTPAAEGAEKLDAQRRVFLRRAALAGLPVLLASVRARTVWAQDTSASAAMSANPSASTATVL